MSTYTHDKHRDEVRGIHASPGDVSSVVVFSVEHHSFVYVCMYVVSGRKWDARTEVSSGDISTDVPAESLSITGLMNPPCTRSVDPRLLFNCTNHTYKKKKAAQVVVQLHDHRRRQVRGGGRRSVMRTGCRVGLTTHGQAA